MFERLFSNTTYYGRANKLWCGIEVGLIPLRLCLLSTVVK